MTSSDTCALCPDGKYSNDLGSCKDCDPTCVQFLKHRMAYSYPDENIDDYEWSVPDGMTFEGCGGSSIGTCYCPLGEFLDIGGPAIYVPNAWDGLRCRQCQTMKIRPNNNYENCRQCPNGKTANAERIACEACVPGKYGISGLCYSCHPPLITSAIQASDPSPDAWNYGATGATGCVSCGAGLVFDDDLEMCLACASGTFNPDPTLDGHSDRTYGPCVPCAKTPASTRTSCEAATGAYTCADCICTDGEYCVTTDTSFSCQACAGVRLGRHGERVARKSWFLHAVCKSHIQDVVGE